MTWKCHVGKFTNIIYDIILGRDLLTSLGLDVKFSDNVYEKCLVPMVDVSSYEFKSMTDKTVKP